MANSKSNSLATSKSDITVQFNDPEINDKISTALDVQKENMILEQAKVMDIFLLDDDVKQIKSSLSVNFASQAKLRVAVTREIIKYQEMIDLAVNVEVVLAMQKLSAMKAKSDQKQLANLKEIEGHAKENTEMWKRIHDDVKETFKLSEIENIFD